MQSESLTEVAINIINKRGKFALNEASQQILQYNYGNGIISEALKYYAKVIFPKVLPIFPALTYISCKAVGGEPEKTKSLAAAMLLITASGDIHDDIIDRSTHKLHRKTVFGKYGGAVALLAGDALLTQGLTVLHNNCESLPKGQRETIVNLIAKSMFELVEAEATETRLWKKTDVTPQEYFEVIRHKGGVAELHCKIGGILGCADEVALDNITNYGRIIGILATVKDEFMDILNFSELKQRIKKEMVPYPLFVALKNDAFKKQIKPIITKADFSKKDLPFIVESTFNSFEIKKLKTELQELGENELATNTLLKGNWKENEAVVLLQALAIEL